MDPLSIQSSQVPLEEAQRLAANLCTLITTNFPQLRDKAEKIVEHIIESHDIPVLRVIAISPVLFVETVEKTLSKLIEEETSASSGVEKELEKVDSPVTSLEASGDDEKDQPFDGFPVALEEDDDAVRLDRVPLFARGRTDSPHTPTHSITPDTPSSTASPRHVVGTSPSPVAAVSPGSVAGTNSPSLAGSASQGSVSGTPVPSPIGTFPNSTGATVSPVCLPGSAGVTALPSPSPATITGLPPGLLQVVQGLLQQPVAPIGPQPVAPIGQHPFGQPGYQPLPGQPGYQPHPGQPGYQPHPGQPGYQPLPGQPGYQPQPGQLGYQPHPGQPGFQPHPGQPGFQPNPGQPGFQPHPGFLPYPCPPGQFVQIPGIPGHFSVPFPPGQYPYPPHIQAVPVPNIHQAPPQVTQFPLPAAPPPHPNLPPGFAAPVPTQPTPSSTPTTGTSNNDGKSTPFSLADSEDSSEQLESNRGVSNSSDQEQASDEASPPERTERKGPVPLSALSAPGLPVSVFRLPTVPPGLQVARAPVTVASPVPGQLQQPGPKPKVALSAPGLPVAFSGLPTAPPGQRIPWKLLPDTGIVASPPLRPETPASVDSISADHESFPSPGFPITSPTSSVQSASSLTSEDISKKSETFSWSQVVSGSSGDKLTNVEGADGEQIVEFGGSNVVDCSKTNTEVDPLVVGLSAVSTMPRKKRPRCPSSERGQQAEEFGDFEEKLKNVELVSVIQHSVSAIASKSPLPVSNDDLNQMIKKSRGKGADVKDGGLHTVAACLRKCPEIVVILQSFPGGKGKHYQLTDKGVAYAKFLGCEFGNKQPVETMTFESARFGGQRASPAPQMHGSQFNLEDDDFPALGAKPKKKDIPKPSASQAMPMDRSGVRPGQPLLGYPTVPSGSMRTGSPGLPNPSNVVYGHLGKMNTHPSQLGQYVTGPAHVGPGRYSQLKAECTRTPSPTPPASNTPEPREKKKSDFTYRPDDFGGGMPGMFNTQNITKDNLEAIAEECIDRLANADVLVTPKAVESQILAYTGRSNWSDLRVPSVRRVEYLECVRQLQRMQGKVSTYIQTFVMVRSIATVYDLSVCMKEFITGGGSFDDLKLGPLAKQPTIRENFNLTPGTSLKEISSPLVIEHLRNYVNKNELWTTPVDLKNFLEYLQEEYGTDTPYELGVRIKSLPLAMQMLKKAQRDQGKTVRECIEHMTKLTEKEVKSGFDNFKSKMLLANTDGEGHVIRSYYLQLKPEEILTDVFGKFNALLAFVLEFGKGIKTRVILKLQRAAEEFVKYVNGDELATRLFQMSVCVSVHDMHESLQSVIEKMFPTPKQGGGDDDDGPSGSAQSANPPPKLDDLVSKFRYNLERCIRVSGTLRLEYLAAIERKLCEHFNHMSFNTMGQGSFLHFLLNQPNAKKVFEELGGNNLTAGGSQSADAKNSLYRPSQGDLVDLVQQCGIKEESMESTAQLETAVCSHYKVCQVQGAGHGPISCIQGILKRQKHGQNRDHNVVYESALCVGSRYSEHSVPSAEKHAGILGSQTEEAALLHLEACPLLENLETWSQWSLVFQPQFGLLKTFVQKHGGIRTHRTSTGQTYSTSFQALETEPGVLLKITAKTGIDMFRQYTFNGEVQSACGHLVSLVMENKGLKDMSMELLANHMQSALFNINSEGTERHSKAPRVINFVRDCLCLLPIRICEAVANQIFLEPLSHVLGGTKSKQLILESCPTSAQTSRIYMLGMLLGIESWSKCFQDGLNRAQQSMMPARSRRKTNSYSDLLDDDMAESDNEDVSESESDSDDEHPGMWSDSESDEALSDVEPEERKETDDVEESKDEADMQDATIAVTKDAGETVATDTADTEKDVKDETDITDSAAVEENEEESIEKEEEEKEEEPVIPPEDAHLTPKERECKAVVEQIRKEEFGIGIKLNEDAEKLVRVQQERQGRSLDRLSRDLYSKDTHFVLELVQNADDNTYPPPDPSKQKRSSGPAIRFVVETDSVTVLNNECGFEERNIRALCDVGRSTKGKHKFGYIGQKGIGFKSVFRVTDKPQVHSNGYHVCFDVSSGPMGYILPHWIDDETPETATRWTTKIVLKLKDELDMSKGHQQTRTLANRFHDIHPSLLLFLHRLRIIVIENKVDNEMLKMARRDIGDNIIEIRHNAGTDKWLVTKKLLDANKISPQGKSGADVESTEIALAFPLHGRDKGSSQYRPPQQPVFAFLPLRSYGFRFIVQGDFEVPSSREDVDSDSSWNQGLMDAIPQLFIEALDTFKIQPDLNPIDAVNAYLRFVPMENETLDFFKPVASKIHQLLKSKPCLPTEPDADGNVDWKLPSQMVICQDPLIQQVISPEMLEHHIGLFYLHNAVTSTNNTPLLQSLGIKQISTQHLLDIGKSLAKQWQDEDVEARIPSIAMWLVCVYRSLNEYSSNEEELKKLKALAVIPLSKGQLVTLETSTVFFPLQKEMVSAHMTDPLRFLEQDLNTLDPRLLNCLDHISDSQIEKILEQCNVRQLTPQEVIHHHIMPSFKSDVWKSKSRDLLCAYVVYIQHHVTKQRSILNMDELRSVIQVDTNQGMKNPATEPVHFTPAYQNVIDLQKQLPGCKWVLLSSAYMPPNATKQDVSQWRKFFSELGVLDFLAMKKKDVSLSLEELRESPWIGYERLLHDKTGPFTITDYVCAELTDLLTASADCNHAEMQTLFHILDAKFDQEFSQYTKTQLSSPGSMRPLDVETSFALLLKETAWVPGTVIKYTGSVTDSHQELLKGDEVYLMVQKIHQLLDNHVPYLSIKPNQNSSFVAFLQIHSGLTKDEILQFLISWCQRTDNDTKPKIFSTSMDHITAIYNYLRQNLTMQEIKELFEMHPIIFLPKKVSPCHLPCEGEFWFRQEVCWEDPKGLFTKHREELRACRCDVQCPQTLCHIYQGNFQTLFCSSEFGDVRSAPLSEEYLGLLTFIAGYYPDSSVVISDILSIFEILGCELSSQQDHVAECVAADMRRVIGKEKVFPTKAKTWASINEKPMLVDKDQYFKWFDGKDGVHFLEAQEIWEVQKGRKRGRKAAPAYNKEHLAVFLNMCRIPTLSSCVSVLLSTEMYNPCPDLQEFMWRIMPLLQLHLYNMYAECYDALVQEQKVAAKLKVMRFASVGKLEVVYSLKHSPQTVHIQNEVCAIDEWSTFYIHKDHIGASIEIQKEIARVFSNDDQQIGDSIRTFLTDVNQIIKDRGIPKPELICNLKNWDPLPETEEPWEVQRPVVRLPEIPKIPKKLKEPEAKPATEGTEEGKENKMRLEGLFLSQWPPPLPGTGRKTGEVRTGEGLMTMWPPPKHGDEVLPFVRTPSVDGSSREPGASDGQPGAGVRRSESVQSGEGLPMGGRGDENWPRVGGPPSGEHGGSRGPGTGAPGRGEGDHRPADSTAAKSDLSNMMEDRPGESKNTGEQTDVTQDARPPLEQAEPNGESAETTDEHTTQEEQARLEADQTKSSPERLAEHPRVMGVMNGAVGTPPRDTGPRSGSHEGTPSRGFVKMGGDIEEEIIFDDLGDLSISNIPHEIRLDSSDDADEVGRIGEQLVYKFLRRRTKFNGLTIEDVIWINQHQESGDPYDILLKLEDEFGSLQEVFIEVKATKTDDKVTMGVSLRELDFASLKREQYYLYRVFNIGEHKKPKLVSINNIKDKFDRKLLKLVMICPTNIAGGGRASFGQFGMDLPRNNLPAIVGHNLGDPLEGRDKNEEQAASGVRSELLTEALLASLPAQEQKQTLGTRLFPLVSSLTGDTPAGKITGMLLGLKNTEILSLIESPEMLAAQIDEAVRVLKQAGSWEPQPQKVSLTAAKVDSLPPPQQKQVIGEHLFSAVAELVGYQLGRKITGMLLELKIPELLNLLSSPDALTDRVNDAIQVLELYRNEAQETK